MAAKGLPRDHQFHGLLVSRAGSIPMALHFPWFDAWLRGQRRAVPLLHTPARADDELPCEPERPWGCGWFDSSVDLRQGLAVIEHQETDLALVQAVEQLVCPERARR